MTRATTRGAWAAAAAALVLAAGCTGEGGGGLGLTDHASHFVVNGSHTGLACDQCHDPTALSFTAAGLPGDKPGVSCTGCHAQAETTGGHAGVSGFNYATPDCIGCHKDGRTQPFDHTQLFPIAAGDTHQPSVATCADCHGTTRAVADLQCVHCHTGAHDQAAMDGQHSGLANYSWDSPSCYRCHPDGSIPPFDHAFPIGAAAVHNPAVAGCADCHGATNLPADLQCVGCHTGTHAQATMATAHTGVAGYSWDSPSCYRCHQDGSVPLPSNHDADFFPVGTPGSAHAGLACSQCHGADKTLANVTCVPCHDASTTTSHVTTHRIPATTRGRLDGVTYTNYQYASAYCLKCHADGQVDLIAQHTRFPPAGSGCNNVGERSLNDDGHPPFCLACHRTARATGKTWGVDLGRYSCLACHTDNCGNGGGN